MSKIGRKPIILIDKTQAKYDSGVLTISGPLGSLSFKVPEHLIKVSINGSEIFVSTNSNKKLSRSMHGTARSIINNMLLGVTQGYSKSLIVEGIGYKAAIEGSKIKLDVGYSHSVYVDIPTPIKVKVEKNKITIFGIDKQAVGDFAAKIQEIRPPDAYKGKGIRFEGQSLKLKPGKKAGVTASSV